MRNAALAAAAAVALAACGGTAPPPRHAPPPAAATTPTAAAAPATGDAHACWAFRQATTKGVPASAAGTDTMTWLQDQLANPATPVQAAVQQYVNAWDPAPHVRAIHRAARLVKQLCQGVAGQ